MLNKDEKERSLEIIFYYFFYEKLSNKRLNTSIFWKLIKEFNDMYNINNIDISKAVKILFDSNNKPTGLETYYLLDKGLFTVREIKRMTKIYYKKQLEYRDQINDGKLKLPILPKVKDLMVKRTIKEFIRALYDFSSYFTYIDSRTIDNLF